MSHINLEGNKLMIDNYDKISPFSSFLPGLAGVKGIPIWSFYTNRGQGINSFGIHNKNNAIMEFNPANTAYENVSLKGFRTFIKVDGNYFEPFYSIGKNSKRNMYIEKNSFSIVEYNLEHGIQVHVKYFILPQENIGALVRKVTITNISDHSKQLEVIDGMPKIIPFGINNNEYKEKSNLLKSWTEIKNIDHNIPYYTLRASCDDTEEVSEIKGGYFYLTIFNQMLSTVIYDPDVIFGYEKSFREPVEFKEHHLTYLAEAKQCYSNKIPCGFTPLAITVGPGESQTFTTLVGFANTVSQINSKITEFCSFDYSSRKEKIADEIIEDFTKDVKTKTSNPVFDQYIEQCYLDNFLRGGYPYVFGEGENKSVIHLFSRKHGDPERDYNFFAIAGEYFSQGNGNFRDINQNRRNDVFFKKEVEDFNIKTFYSLIQIDGYNPLEVRPSTFSVREKDRTDLINYIMGNVDKDSSRLIRLIEEPFTPGKIANGIGRYDIKLNCKEDIFIATILSYCDENIEAGFIEGYWSDHWTYNLDLIEDYIKIYPDNEKELLYDKKIYRFYDSGVRVLPRSQKYVIHNDRVRQYGACIPDEEKALKEKFCKDGTNWIKTKDGTIYETTLMVKLISLALNKFTLLDSYGMGIEMEGGKPGWNDAMNGLPALFGSSMAETYELTRLLKYMIKNLTSKEEISIPVEIYDLLLNVSEILNEKLNDEIDEFSYWDKVGTLRESYRDKVRFDISGEERKIYAHTVQNILIEFLKKVEMGIEKAWNVGEGIVPTYFTYEASEYVPIMNENNEPVINYNGYQTVKVTKFNVKVLPRFLEGPAKMLRTIDDKKVAEQVYLNVRKSDIYDSKLKMYKISGSIEELSMETGRVRAFTPGWLERESVFLHMEYKYLLGLLRAGLYDLFYIDIKNTLIPFLDPDVYGRSILENSTFIASSVNPDSQVHGRGFVARLSGSTSEVISMWIDMFVGNKVFTYTDQVLRLHFEPKLPGWLFDENGEVSFQLLSNCKVTYKNLERKDTFGAKAGRILRITIIDDNSVIQGNVLEGQWAERVRNGEIEKMLIEIQ